MGKWIATNGEATYGTLPTLFGPEAGAYSPTEKEREGKPKFVPAWNWRSTTSTDRIYLELFTWPSGSFHLDTLPRNVTGAYLLPDPSHKALKLTRTATGFDVELPAKPLDAIATVLVLETGTGKP